MELVEQQPGSPDAWDEAFAVFHARFAPFFYRREVRERSARYLRGLLGPVERKNGWQLAEAGGETDPQGMQQLGPRSLPPAVPGWASGLASTRSAALAGPRQLGSDAAQ